jgi:hypothetical protein
MEDGFQEVFLMALKDVAEAKGIYELACVNGHCYSAIP